MGWLVPRTLAALGALLAGAVAGATAGAWFGHVGLWSAAGAVGVLAAAVWLDSWRGHRLLVWLRGPLADAAPRETGFWGELGYRVERSLRAREAALNQERLRLAQFFAAIEASPNGVILLDATDQVDWCNAVAAEHFGLDLTRDRRQRVTNLVRSPAFVAYLQGGHFDDGVVFPGPLGRTTLSVLVRPYGEGMKLVLTQDITERERADAMRRDFVANVSHEIRTPLTVLSGFVETLASLPLTEAERQRVLALMSQQAGRMQALVGDLLTLAELEGSPPPAASRWFALAGVMQRAHTDAESLSAGGHTIVAFDGEDAELAGSEQEIFSAVGNLLNNAVRYTPAGGSITLRWRWRDDGGGELDVSDTGIGVSREHLSRLTERFYRVDGSRSRDTGGTGLGLSIVKHVVQRHGGEIQIDSEPGKGSSFKLVFPAQRVRRQTVPSDLPATSA